MLDTFLIKIKGFRPPNPVVASSSSQVGNCNSSDGNYFLTDRQTSIIVDMYLSIDSQIICMYLQFTQVVT